MSRPSPWTYLVGNGLVQVALFLAVGWTIYAGFTQGIGAVPAIVCLVLARISYRAGERVRDYRLWKMEWDSMAPPRRGRRRFR